MTKEPWYESDSERRVWWAIFGRASAVIAILVVLGVVSAMGALAWRYFIAGPTGKVQKQEIIQNGTNQLTQQATFEQLNSDIKAYGVQIGTTAQALKASPGDQHLQTILLGLKNQCASAVGQYNALARTERAEAFKAADLPPSFDAATACAGPSETPN